MGVWVRLWMACGLVACGSNRSDVKPGKPGDASGPQTLTLSDEVSETRRADEKITRYDLNHDGTPDVFSASVTVKGEDGKETQRLVRKELDLNYDGKVDITRFYDDNEQVEKEAYDLDFDGKIDQVNYYEKGVCVRKERDLNSDGHTDLWLYLEKGHIVRKEKDSNGDGKVDYWEYWENDVVDRVGEDLDGDGTVDRWTKNPESGAGQ
jgi:antitoxin component YwqK of YwqJK toxin-antitoxin module